MDLSHLYQTETVEVAGFSVVVREIAHGQVVDLQRRAFGDIHMSQNKSELKRQLEAIRLDVTGFADEKNVLAIQSWTLQDAAGNDVPVSLEAWRALPEAITDRIEEVVDRLNPDADDFQGEPGAEGES